jgi:hyperosmotically inducible periplasmic protein
MFRKVLVAAFILGLSSAAASAEIAPERKTLQIVNDITGKVRQYTRFTIFDDVNVRMENGVAVLTGSVTMGFKREDIGKLVATVPGVVSVNNQLAILPTSPFDDELRHRIAHAIYGNANFWNYAAMPNPPIHIVVTNGHVTLTGVVQNNVDRMLARSLATDFGAFDVKNELKTEAEMKDLLEKI